MTKGEKIYRDLLKASREDTKRMVESGELSEEDGAFRDWMMEDEILLSMDDELFEQELDEEVTPYTN